MHPNHAHRLLGVRHPLVHRQRDNKRSVPSGNRGNRGYSFRYPVLRLHSLVIHPLIPTEWCKTAYTYLTKPLLFIPNNFIIRAYNAL